jgi:hypothetical protein
MDFRGAPSSFAVIGLGKIGQLEVDCEGFRDKVGISCLQLLHYPSRFYHLRIFETRAGPLPGRLFAASDEEAPQLFDYFEELLT